MTNSIDEAFSGGGAKSAFGRTDQIGRTCGGTVISATLQQARVMDRDGKPTSELRKWDNGDPVLQLVVIVQTSERDPNNPDDDGRRAIYVKTWGEDKKRVNEAAAAAGFTKLSEAFTPGNQFWAKLASIDPSTAIPRKDYEYKFVRASAAGIDQAMAQPAPAQQAPQQAYAAPQGQPQGFGYGQAPAAPAQPAGQPFGPPQGGPGEPPF